MRLRNGVVSDILYLDRCRLILPCPLLTVWCPQGRTETDVTRPRRLWISSTLNASLRGQAVALLLHWWKPITHARWSWVNTRVYESVASIIISEVRRNAFFALEHSIARMISHSTNVKSVRTQASPSWDLLHFPTEANGSYTARETRNDKSHRCEEIDFYHNLQRQPA